MVVDIQLEMLEIEEHLAMALQAGLALRTSVKLWLQCDYTQLPCV